MLKRYFGDRAFYRRVLMVAIPIIVQNGITQFVSLLDNIMVGQVGTIQMSGVSIVNQLMFVFNLCVFGASSGAGIFTAQFNGSRDHEGIRHTFRFKLISCLVISAIGVGIFALAGSPLIGVYLQGEGNPKDAAMALGYGMAYLRIMLLGLLPFALCNAYASTLRECGQTVVPMVGGITAVLVNLVLNYILIFGHFGFPQLGVQGAAVATVISRYVELAVVAGWTHLHVGKNPFIKGAYQSVYIPGKLLKAIAIKGMPLLLNEFLWSTGNVFINQCYSTCGLEVVPAMNIASTLFNLASVSFIATGNSVGILMGQMLGASCPVEEIKDTNRKLITMSIMTGTVFGCLMMTISTVFPNLYNTTDSVRWIATRLIWINCAMFPFISFTNAAYFTLRSGGQTMVTFLFDSCFSWGVCVPLAFCLSRFTDLTIIPMTMICMSTDFLKSAIGFFMIKKGSWIQNLTN